MYFQLITALVILKLVKFMATMLKWSRIHRSYATLGNNTAGNTIFSKRVIAILVISYAICATFWGLVSAAQLPNVKKITVPIRGLPTGWKQKRIVQLTDIHLGPTVGRSKLEAIVDIVNELDPGMYLYLK
jgi:hypothetical protein